MYSIWIMPYIIFSKWHLYDVFTCLMCVEQGCIPTMGRAVVVNAAQLASYSQAKQTLLTTGKYMPGSCSVSCLKVMSLSQKWCHNLCLADYFKDDIFCHFVASMISGLITTIASMPVDIAKTRWPGSFFNLGLRCQSKFTPIFNSRIQNMKTVEGIPEYTGAIVSLLCLTSI